MAKRPEDRYTTCAALITAAEAALELRRPPAVSGTGAGHRCRCDAPCPRRGASRRAHSRQWRRRRGRADRQGEHARPHRPCNEQGRVRSSTSARDPPRPPSAGAVSGSTTRRPVGLGDRPGNRHPTTYHQGRRGAERPDALKGPVLAADAAGAWLIGVDARGRSYLTRVFSGPRGKREYRLSRNRVQSRSATAPSGSSPEALATMRCCASTRPPARSPSGRASPRPRRSTVSPLALAASGLWPRRVRCSIGSILARHAVTGRIDLGKRAARPEVVLGSIWVGLFDYGGDTVIVDSRTQASSAPWLLFSEAGETAGYGSIWQYDPPTGTVVRWDGQTYQVADDIRVTAPPFYDGLCLTSIAAGAGAVWATVTATSTPAAEPPAAPQPASAHPQPLLSPGGHACLGCRRTKQGGEQCAGS